MVYTVIHVTLNTVARTLAYTFTYLFCQRQILQHAQHYVKQQW